MTPKSDNKNAELLFTEGTKLYEQGNYHEAEIKLKKALKVSPTSEDIMYNLALVYFEQKKYDLSWAMVDKIKEIDCKELFYELKKTNFVYKSSKIECPSCGHIINESDWRCPTCYFEFKKENDFQAKIEAHEAKLNKNDNNEPHQESVLNVTYLTKEELDEYNLKENDGSYCPKCKVTHFEKTSKCVKCDGNTLSTKWYSRFCKERLAFIFTLPIFITIAFQIFSEDKPNIFLVYFISVFALFSLYTTASTFIGIGGFTEKFPANNLPIRAFDKFSFSRYFSEFIRIIFIFLALGIFFGIVKLLKCD